MRPYGRSGMKHLNCPRWLFQRIRDYKVGKALLLIRAVSLSGERINCIFPAHQLNGLAPCHLNKHTDMQKSLEVAKRLKAFLDEMGSNNLMASDAKLALYKDREYIEKSIVILSSDNVDEINGLWREIQYL